MPLLVPNAAEVEMLADILREPHILRLFTNDKTPAPTDSAENYTEAKGSGYAEFSMHFNEWKIAAGETKDMPTEASFPEHTFEFTGALGDVYGYFVTRANGRLRWAERFPNAPVNVSGSNVRIKITPHLTLE